MKAQGFNCGHYNEGDGLALLIGFKEQGIEMINQVIPLRYCVHVETKLKKPGKVR